MLTGSRSSALVLTTVLSIALLGVPASGLPPSGVPLACDRSSDGEEPARLCAARTNALVHAAVGGELPDARKLGCAPPSHQAVWTSEYVGQGHGELMLRLDGLDLDEKASGRACDVYVDARATGSDVVLLFPPGCLWMNSSTHADHDRMLPEGVLNICEPDEDGTRHAEGEMIGARLPEMELVRTACFAAGSGSGPFTDPAEASARVCFFHYALAGDGDPDLDYGFIRTKGDATGGHATALAKVALTEMLYRKHPYGGFVLSGYPEDHTSTGSDAEPISYTGGLPIQVSAGGTFTDAWENRGGVYGPMLGPTTSPTSPYWQVFRHGWEGAMGCDAVGTSCERIGLGGGSGIAYVEGNRGTSVKMRICWGDGGCGSSSLPTGSVFWPPTASPRPASA